jgi:peptidyl-prolyl cis-trans isomerase D
MVKEFDEASFSGKIGVIQKPVKTQFGYHIIKVMNKLSSKFIIEKIIIKIEASGTTIENASSSASDFSFLSKKNGFEITSGNYNYKVLSTPVFEESAQMIPGIGKNIGLLKFTFDGSVGDISDPFKVPTGYLVAMIAEIHEQEYSPLETIKEQIKNKLILEKKLDMGMEILKEIYPKISKNGQIDKAREFNEKLRIGSASNISIKASTPGIGRDFAFNGYALNGPLNKISEPIRGERGCYLIKVTQRTPFDSTRFEVQKAGKKQQITNTKQQAIIQRWLSNLIAESDIIDNRYKFYR